MKVREGTPEDRDAIVSFDQIARSDAARVAFVERALRSETCLVAEQRGAVVGYAVLEYTFYEQGFVSMLYVAEAARRRGIGRTLMREIEARCRTAKLFTSTNQSNGPMQALLDFLGYVPSGVIHNLDPGDPELVYFLDLSSSTAGREAAPAMEPAIRPMTMEDYQGVMELWRSTEGIVLSDTDEREPMQRFLGRNPGLSLVAHLGGELAGVVLCSHDGRRGYMHHLATAGRFRGQGIGSALARESRSRLAQAGIRKCNVFVLPENHQGIAFWERNGFRMLPHYDWMQAISDGDD